MLSSPSPPSTSPSLQTSIWSSPAPPSTLLSDQARMESSPSPPSTLLCSQTSIVSLPPPASTALFAPPLNVSSPPPSRMRIAIACQRAAASLRVEAPTTSAGTLSFSEVCSCFSAPWEEACSASIFGGEGGRTLNWYGSRRVEIPSALVMQPPFSAPGLVDCRACSAGHPARTENQKMKKKLNGAALTIK